MAKKKKGTRRKVIVFTILVLGLAGLTVAALLKRKEVLLTVETQEVQRRDITEVVLADGSIQPVVQVKISPEVSGEIVSLPVREGQHVRQGDVLVKIKPDFYEASVRRAEASHQQALAGLELSRAEQAKAEVEFKRARMMFEQEINSAADFDTARTERDVAISRAVQAEHQVEMAAASLASAQEDQAKTTIRSPLTGTVSKLNSELGERVLGTAQNMGTEIMVIADLNEMEARVEIGEIDIVLIKPGQTARLEVDAFRDRTFTGVVTEIGNSALTRGTGSQQQATKFEVRIRINEKEAFRPGMSVSADIETRHRTNVVAVPIQCVTQRLPATPAAASSSSSGDATNAPAAHQDDPAKPDRSPDPVEVVFLAEDGKARMVPVTRGISDDDRVEITEGLEAGQTVITGSYRAIDRDLKDGASIEVRKGGGKGGEAPGP